MKRRLRRFALGTLVVVLALAGAGWVLVKTQTTHHSPPSAPPAAVTPTEDALLDAIRRGIEFLKVYQEDDQEFSKGWLDPKPAVTALVVDSIANSPDRHSYESSKFIRGACDVIVSHQQEDGGIYTPAFGLGNYCTSISIMALRAADAAGFEAAITRAVAYLRGCQLGDAAGEQAGGFGYGGGGGNADLSNTLQSLEALRRAGISPDDEAFERAVAFVSRCQNSSETNSEAWALDDGGFIYRPGTSKAGEVKLPDGGIGYKSYGLMSYAGLMSLLHADLGKDDPRVQAALRWVRSNYTFDENVNLGAHGLYYYYLVMAKALAAAGERTISDDEGEPHDWAEELSAKLMAEQAPDGSWSNRMSDRWMEGDSVLVTAYVVRALSICWGVLNPDGTTQQPR